MQVKNIVAGIKYQKDGEDRTQWVNVGSLFIKDDGKMSVKLNGYINPLAFKNEKGEIWLNVFDKKGENAPKNVQSVGVNTEPTTPQEKWKEELVSGAHANTPEESGDWF